MDFNAKFAAAQQRHANNHIDPNETNIETFLPDGDVDAEGSFGDLNLQSSIVQQNPDLFHQPATNRPARDKDFGFEIDEEEPDMSALKSTVSVVQSQTVVAPRFQLQFPRRSTETKTIESAQTAPVEKKPVVMQMARSAVELEETRRKEESEDIDISEPHAKKKGKQPPKTKSQSAKDKHKHDKQKKQQKKESSASDESTKEESMSETVYLVPEPLPKRRYEVVTESIGQHRQRDRDLEQTMPTVQQIAVKRADKNAPKEITVQRLTKKPALMQKVDSAKAAEKKAEQLKVVAEPIPSNYSEDEVSEAQPVPVQPNKTASKSLQNKTEQKVVQQIKPVESKSSKPVDKKKMAESIPISKSPIRQQPKADILDQIMIGGQQIYENDQLDMGDLNQFDDSIPQINDAQPSMKKPSIQSSDIFIPAKKDKVKAKPILHDSIQVVKTKSPKAAASQKSQRSESQKRQKEAKKQETRQRKAHLENSEDFKLSANDTESSESARDELNQLYDTNASIIDMKMLKTANVEQSLIVKQDAGLKQLLDAIVDPQHILGRRLAEASTRHRELISLKLDPAKPFNKRMALRQAMGERFEYDYGVIVGVRLCFEANPEQQQETKERANLPQRMASHLKKLPADQALQFKKDNKSSSTVPVQRFEQFRFDELQNGVFSAGLMKIDQRNLSLVAMEADSRSKKMTVDTTAMLMVASGEIQLIISGEQAVEYVVRQHDCAAIPKGCQFEARTASKPATYFMVRAE